MRTSTALEHRLYGIRTGIRAIRKGKSIRAAGAKHWNLKSMLRNTLQRERNGTVTHCRIALNDSEEQATDDLMIQCADYSVSLTRKHLFEAA